MRHYLREIKATLALALPMCLGFVGTMLLFFIDGVMIGRLGVAPLAGYTYGSQIVSILLVGGFGLCAAQHILGAAAFQRRDGAACSAILLAGVLVSLAYALACALFFQLCPGVLQLFGQQPEVVAEATGYTRWIAWSMVPTLLYQCLKNFAESQGRSWVPLTIFGPALPLNALLNWLLIHGHGGLPAMGTAGAGLATLLTRSLMLCVLSVRILYFGGFLRGPWRWPGSVPMSGIRHYLRIGLPTGMQALQEHLMFVVVTIWMGWFGAAALAAHQIALRMGSFAFMPALALGFAVSIRISQAAAAGDRAAVRRIGGSALLFSALLMLGACLFFILTRHQLGWLFFATVDADTRAVVELAASLILIMAYFQFFDALQFIANGALRGLADVRAPTIISLVLFWGLAMPLAYGLAFHTDWGPRGLWLGLFAGLFLNAIVLTTRFLRAVRGPGDGG